MDNTTQTETPVFEEPLNVDEQLKQIAEQYAINQSIGRILVRKYTKLEKLKNK
jgi:hypothetical protein